MPPPGACGSPRSLGSGQAVGEHADDGRQREERRAEDRQAGQPWAEGRWGFERLISHLLLIGREGRLLSAATCPSKISTPDLYTD